MLTEQEIKYLKNNKHEITPELLELLRTTNEGKDIALEILDFELDSELCYLDANGNQISYNGIKDLKRENTVLNLSPIHLHEIERCSKDFRHFRDNYIKIKTKAGVTFPEVRDYQERFIDALINPQYDEVIGLMGRQCVSADSLIKVKMGNVEEDLTVEDLWNKF